MTKSFGQISLQSRCEKGGIARLASAAMMAASLVWFASPAMAADNFCTQLKAIAADAPNGFSTLRGAQTKQEASAAAPYGMVDYYAVSSSLDGASSCDIEIQETATSDGLHYPNYACEFPITGKNKGTATRKLANRVAACLGNVSRPAGPGLDADGGMLLFHSTDYSVSYSTISGPFRPTISFSIQSEKH